MTWPLVLKGFLLGFPEDRKELGFIPLMLYKFLNWFILFECHIVQQKLWSYWLRYM